MSDNIKKAKVKKILKWTPLNNRIRKSQISSKHQKLTFIQIYTTTMETDGDEKQDFFNQMHYVLHCAISMT